MATCKSLNKKTYRWPVFSRVGAFQAGNLPETESYGSPCTQQSAWPSHTQHIKATPCTIISAWALLSLAFPFISVDWFTGHWTKLLQNPGPLRYFTWPLLRSLALMEESRRPRVYRVPQAVHAKSVHKPALLVHPHHLLGHLLQRWPE